jgi:hypothetical protein
MGHHRFPFAVVPDVRLQRAGHDAGSSRQRDAHGTSSQPDEQPLRGVVDRIETLDPIWIRGVHGGSLVREAIPHFTRALRKEPVTYQGKLLCRVVLPS